jgi:hypothetical protein
MLAVSCSYDGKNSIASVYVTFDGGRTWHRSRGVIAKSLLFLGADPVVYFGPRGEPFFVNLGSIDGRSTTMVSRSRDGGRTWPKPQILVGRDREYVAFDTINSNVSTRIFLAGGSTHGVSTGGRAATIVLSQSLDNGVSFTPGESFFVGDTEPRTGRVTSGHISDMVVTPDGVLAMAYLAGRDKPVGPEAQDITAFEVLMLTSDDGGKTFQTRATGLTKRTRLGHAGERASHATRAAIDMSHGPHRGRLYLVYTDYDGQAWKIKVARSDDVGQTWITADVLDAPPGKDPANAAIAVNRFGTIMVVWNDRRDDPKGECWRLYGSVSVDGGETFSRNTRLSESPVCVTAPGNWLATAYYALDRYSDPSEPLPGFLLFPPVPTRFPNGGDTQGLMADENGVFHAAWINGNGKNGALQLWYSRLEVDGSIQRAPDVLSSSDGERGGLSARSAIQTRAGFEDVSDEVLLETEHPLLDFQSHTGSARIRLVNRSGRRLTGPLQLVLARAIPDTIMGLRHWRALSPDAGGNGVGAAWYFSTVKVLAPNARTGWKTIRFSFEGEPPSAPEGYFFPLFRIFAKTAP